MKATRGERLKNPKLRKFATGMRAVLIKEANNQLIKTFREERGFLDNRWVNPPDSLLNENGSIDSARFTERNQKILDEFEHQKDLLRSVINKLHGSRRIIRLTIPKIIKIRTGFRKLLEKEWSKRNRELEVQDNILHQKYYHDKKIDEATYDAKFRETEDQQSKLKKLRKASITSCASCGDMEKDHVFVPQTREWYCEKCLRRLDDTHYFEEDYNWEYFKEFRE